MPKTVTTLVRDIVSDTSGTSLVWGNYHLAPAILGYVMSSQNIEKTLVVDKTAQKEKTWKVV